MWGRHQSWASGGPVPPARLGKHCWPHVQEIHGSRTLQSQPFYSRDRGHGDPHREPTRRTGAPSSYRPGNLPQRVTGQCAQKGSLHACCRTAIWPAVHPPGKHPCSAWLGNRRPQAVTCPHSAPFGKPPQILTSHGGHSSPDIHPDCSRLIPGSDPCGISRLWCQKTSSASILG